MTITCKLENKSAGLCDRPAIAMIHSDSGPIAACHFHTHRAGMANVVLLDDVLGLLLEQSALDLSSAVLKHLTNLTLEERAQISARVLEAYALESEAVA